MLKEGDKQVVCLQITYSNNIELYFFTAPFYNRSLNTAVLHEHLPQYKDFSNTVDDYRLFKDPTHLNQAGAKQFTTLFIEAYFR